MLQDSELRRDCRTKKNKGVFFQSQKRVVGRSAGQGCQIFLWYNIPKQKKYTKLPQNTPNGRQIDQMHIK
jgi:hypothetical protein